MSPARRRFVFAALRCATGAALLLQLLPARAAHGAHVPDMRDGDPAVWFFTAPGVAPARLHERAEAGEPGAQLELARRCRAQHRDDCMVRWLTAANEQGNARAQYLLGLLYLRGVGVAQDPQQAAYFLGKAAQAHEVHAQYRLGLLLGDAQFDDPGVASVPDELRQGEQWLRAAAEAGYAPAQYRMGLLCRRPGSDCTQRAADYLSQAAAQGRSDAAYMLAQDATAHGEQAPARASAPSPTVRLATVTVATPATTASSRVPKGSYTVVARQLHELSATSLPDALAAQLPGAALTHEQGNAWQPTLRFNGFAASPLLGTPQGFSAYVDGARVNEAFGDTLSWDLIPPNAIRSITLVPYADPVYGLNTLGGSLLVRTLDGRSAPGGEIELRAGSFGRDSEQARIASTQGPWSYFVAAANAHDDGFAPYSPSARRSLFAKATRDDGGHHLRLSYTYAQSRLSGSQTLPLGWMDTPTAIYSAPDYVDNQLAFLQLADTEDLAGHWSLSAHAYLRNSDQSGFNSNVNNAYDGAPPSLADPVATNTASTLRQRTRGLSLAARGASPLAGLPNVLDLGVDAQHQQVDFAQRQQAATFTPQRYAVGIGPFDQAPVNLGVTNTYAGAYVQDALSPTRWLGLNLAARYQHADVNMQDLLGGPLGGRHAFSRWNPSLGLDLHPTRTGSYFLRYAQGMRVPMPVELSCASPTAPCTLPNVLVADPALQPEIARTTQAGATWHLAGLRVRALLTHTDLANALQFISLATMSQGYYANIPRELMRSASVDVAGGSERWEWTASISRTLATYESGFLVPSPANSSANANGTIQVDPGARIPDIPAWTAAASARFTPNQRWALRTRLTAFGRRYAQGDENNQDAHGSLPAFAVLDLGARYRIDRHWKLDVSVHNLFNRSYYDFGQLGTNVFTGPGRSYATNPADWQSAQFVAPGAPRGAWLGLRYSWS